jgi:hypothetical protein
LTANSYTSCTENSGEIHVEITGGNSPYTVEWSNGATATSLSGLSGGSYTISVSDALGCSIDSTFVVNVVTPTVFEGSVGHVVCNGESNGSIDLTILDGSPGYIFEWDNGMSSEDLYGLSPGTYRVKITDGNGCSVYASYDVLEPEELSATILVEQPSNIENGNIDLSVEGGTLPYTYTWNTGDLSEDLYNISAGYYGATVIDDNGCVLFIDETVQNINTASINDTESFSITVFPNPTKDLATITWESIDVSHIVVINTSGQLVQSSNSFAQKSFKTNALTQGVYFINITDNNNNKTTHKLIVK